MLRYLFPARDLGPGVGKNGLVSLSAIAVAENSSLGMHQHPDQAGKNNAPTGMIDDPGAVAAGHVKPFQLHRAAVGSGMTFRAGK